MPDDTPPHLSPAAVPYWRAGLSAADAAVAARVTARHVRDLRDATLFRIEAAGVPVARVASVFGVSQATVRRALRDKLIHAGDAVSVTK